MKKEKGKRAAPLLRLIARAAGGALQQVFHAADGNHGDYEEDRDKAHAAFGYKIRDRAAVAAAHGLRRLTGAPGEELCADDEKHVAPAKKEDLKKADDNACGAGLAKPGIPRLLQP
jgi:hypothetical protein